MENDPITVLIEEHKVILKVVSECDAIAQELNAGRNVEAGLLLRIVEFLREFADKCHHAKEEDLLFPAFENAGVPSSGCPLEALRAEHMKGRKLVMQLEESANAYANSVAGATEGITTALSGIAKLYPNHIWKEDAMVFPMAERLFSPERRKEPFDAFEEVEAKTDQDAYSKFVSFAEGLNDLH